MPLITYCFYSAILYILTLLLLPLIGLFLLFSQRVRAEFKARFLDAFRISVNLNRELPTVWFHASSIGEMKVAVRLLEEMRKSRDFNAVLSVYTRTALQEGSRIEGLAGFFLLPLDLPCLMGGLMQKVSPDLLVVIESELWLSMVHAAKARGAKVVLANGRMSEKAFLNHRKTPLLIKAVLEHFDLILARSKEDADRLQSFLPEGRNAEVAGNIKYDIEPAATTGLNDSISDGNAHVCLASTRDGEEELLLEALQKRRKELFDGRNLKFILVPRHINRIDGIKQLLERHSFPYVLYSENRKPGKEEFVLVDSFGMLNNCYAASIGAFIGGSLVKTGGQNLLEPIALGVPVAFGSDMSNFREESEFFLKHGAIQCRNAGEVVDVFIDWLANPGKANETGRGLREALRLHQGVVKGYAEKLLAMI